MGCNCAIQRLIGPHNHRLANTRFQHNAQTFGANCPTGFSFSSNTPPLPAPMRPPVPSGLADTQPKRSGQCSPAYSADSPPKLCPATTVRLARSLKGAIFHQEGNNSCCTASQKSALHGQFVGAVRGVDNVDQHIHGGTKCRRWSAEVSTGQTEILCAQNSPSRKLPADVLLRFDRRS